MNDNKQHTNLTLEDGENLSPNSEQQGDTEERTEEAAVENNHQAVAEDEEESFSLIGSIFEYVGILAVLVALIVVSVFLIKKTKNLLKNRESKKEVVSSENFLEATPTVVPSETLQKDSKGKTIFIYPDEEAEDAYLRLREEGHILSDIVLKYSNKIPRGKIIDIVTLYDENDKPHVTIYESLGPRQIIVPRVIGKEQDEAEQILHLIGIDSVFAFETGTSNNQTVLWQSTEGLLRGDTVATIVCLVFGDAGSTVRLLDGGGILLPNEERFESEDDLREWFLCRSLFRKNEDGVWERIANSSDQSVPILPEESNNPEKVRSGLVSLADSPREIDVSGSEDPLIQIIVKRSAAYGDLVSVYGKQ